MILLLAVPAFAQGSGKAKFKPLPATGVELVKKLSLHGPLAIAKGDAIVKGKPSWAGGGKNKKKGAATGKLGAECTGTKYAILVGISDYPGADNDLKYADDDALAMYQALTTLYGYDSTNIRLLINDPNTGYDVPAPTADNIFGAVEDIKGLASSGDEVVFFFSGHGAKGFADDGDKERVDEAIVSFDESGNLAYIWDGQLRGWFSGFNTSRIVFVFDSCLSGGMTDLKADGRVINMASTERGYSYESDVWGHGEFTYYFVAQGMLEGQADRYDHDGDSLLSEPSDVVDEEAFDYAAANCSYDKPTISDEFTNDLIL